MWNERDTGIPPQNIPSSLLESPNTEVCFWPKWIKLFFSF